MLYHLENELRDHSVGLKLALKSCQGRDPDLLIITEDGSKIFTKSIILSLYSKVFTDIMADHTTKGSDIPTILISVPSAPPVLNLLKILTEGLVLSTDSQALLEVGKVAQLLDIKLEGMQLGSRKSKATASSKAKNDSKEEVASREVNQKNSTDENSSATEDDNELKTLEEDVKDIKPDIDSIMKDEKEKEESGKPSFERGQRDCRECGKTFTTKQALERHFMQHTGERPFKCDECEKAFRTIFAMKQHKITHTDEKPFACHCGVQFTLKASLKRHEEKAHESS